MSVAGGGSSGTPARAESLVGGGEGSSSSNVLYPDAGGLFGTAPAGTDAMPTLGRCAGPQAWRPLPNPALPPHAAPSRHGASGRGGDVCRGAQHHCHPVSHRCITRQISLQVSATTTIHSARRPPASVRSERRHVFAAGRRVMPAQATLARRRAARPDGGRAR